MRQAGIASPGTVFEYGYPDTPAPNYPFGYPQVAGLPYLGDFGQYQQLAGLGGSNFGNSAGTNFGDVLNLPVATSPSIAGGFAPQAPLPFFDFASGVGAGSGLGFGDFGFDNFTGFVNPIVLDLAGQGLNVTPLGSSNAFFDTAGDGYQHRTAWAGAGNGVLVLDLDGNGDVNSPRSFQFTTWDPTAKTDIEALAHVFGRSCRVVERRCVIVAAS
ncbi:MAG: hypothetical protein A4S14_05465 [Proteobacteria bacterium SG_bin9]|nr:MAG: hypothetical protein A4S14_05465 [Proteobacteria bacterium SG_bin9]